MHTKTPGPLQLHEEFEGAQIRGAYNHGAYRRNGKKKRFEFEDFFNGFHSSYIEGTLVFKMSCRFTVLDLK